MATGLELGLNRLRARRQPGVSDDRDSSAEFVLKLKRDREKFKRDHPLTPLPSGADDAASKRQHVAPASFECALCASVKPMQSAVKVVGCNHPDNLVCGSCMFTEVCGNAAACPLCRAPASALVQVATGRRYEVTDTALSRLVTQGGELAEPDDPDACHTCHKRGFLLVCEGDGCGQNRCFQCSGLDWPLEDSDPFYCETCAEARVATPMPPDASARQSDAGGVAMVGGGGIAAAQAAPLESEDNEWEGEESEGEESEDGTDERGAQQARQTKAQEASARAAKFQEQQRERVHAPAIADSGVQPWNGVSVEVAQLDESKVRCAPPLSPGAPHSTLTTTATATATPRCRCPTFARYSRPRSRRCGPCAPGRHRCCPRRPTRC